MPKRSENVINDDDDDDKENLDNVNLSDVVEDDEEYLRLVGTHKPGSIVRIELKNFLTHGHAVINPGPRLNMVVGANGTGKSTILNAICLGLGGDPKLLGRADDLREFIMHDQDKAEIIIEIQNKPNYNKHIIRRVIDRNKGSEKGRGRGASTFYINNEKVTIQDVRSIVSNEYGISIDNLCTFLPQDKVGNFSGFTDQGRLLETEKTLSKDGHYYEIHQKLIEDEHNMEKSILDVDTIQDKLNKLQHEFERLEREKDLADEREKALKQIKLLEMKKLWLEFESLREKALLIKEEKDQIKINIKIAREQIAPIENKYNKISLLKKDMDTKTKVIEQNTQRHIKDMEKQETKYEKHDDEIESIMAKLSEIDTKRSKLESLYQESLKRLQQLEEEWNSLPPKEQTEKDHTDSINKMKLIKKDYDNSKNNIRTIKNKFKDLEEKANTLQNKLAKMNDDNARKREKLFRDKRNLGIIYEWLGKNRNLFRKPVIGPIATEITTDSQNAAAYLEFHVNNKILHSFVVETKEDYNKLYDCVRNELKVPINILLVARSTEIKRMYSDEKMNILKREHGVTCYLDETFKAPESVMQALRNYSSVDRVLVGGEKTQYSIDHNQLLDYLAEPDIAYGQQNMQGSVIFSSTKDQFFRYQQTVSRYSKQIGSKIDQVGPAKMLAKGVNPEIKKLAEDELEAIHNEISEVRPDMMNSEKKFTNLESELQQINLKSKATKQALESWSKFENKLNRQREKVQEAKSELETDDTKEKKDLVKSLMGRLQHAITAMETHSEQHREMMKLTFANAGILINKTTLSAAERAARAELTECQQAYSTLEASAKLIQKQFQDIKQKVGLKKSEAESAAPLVDSDGNDLPLKDELSAIEVENLNELDAVIEEIERSIEGIHDNPDAIRQYNKLKDEIEDITSKLDEVRNSRESRLTKLQKMREPWESALESYTSKINVLFTNYMAEMGCTGEVRLKKDTSTGEGDNKKSNFKDWGIEILVSFREGAKAQILSAERHSGGERSVSTILYLMALQDLMVSPFRCVDEINQGLDDRNERLVFKRIVQNSTRKPKAGLTDHSGQYFLITPKLLPNLTDMEEHAVTILFVYNGIFNFKHPTECNFLEMGLGNYRGIEANEDNDDNVEEEIVKNSKRKAKKRRSS